VIHTSYLKTTLAVALLGLTGCVSNKNELVQDSEGIATIRENDKALAYMQGGLAALRRGNDEEAEIYFDKAAGIAGGIVAKDFRAALARSYFFTEETKHYLGEPHERALCFYYRGLLFWKKQEYDNARACFRSAALLSTAGETNQSGFVLFDYLDGYGSFLLRQDPSDKLALAQESAKQRSLPPFKDANLYVFIEVGEGIQKVALGEHKQSLGYQRPKCDVRSIRLTADGHTENIQFWDDIGALAGQSGRAVMDQVLANKALFKEEQSQRADVLLRGGSITKTSWWGTSTISGDLPGEIARAFDTFTRPEADTRTWLNLPQFLCFTSQKLPPGSHSIRIEYLDPAGAVIQPLTQELSFDLPEKEPVTLFTYTPGVRGSPSRRFASSLEDLFQNVPDGRSFPLDVELFQYPKDILWEAVAATLKAREEGLQANRETGVIMTRVTRHGVMGSYRQYLVEVRAKSPNSSELRFVQLLYYPHVPDPADGPTSQTRLDAQRRGSSDPLDQAVTGAEQPGFAMREQIKGFLPSVLYMRERNPEFRDRNKRAFLQAVSAALPRADRILQKQKIPMTKSIQSASRPQQLEEGKISTDAKGIAAEELHRIDLLNPEKLIEACIKVREKAKPHFSKLSSMEAAQANPLSVPAFAAADVVVKGIEVIAFPFRKFKEERPARFDQSIFVNNYQNRVYRFFGKIERIDPQSRILTFQSVGSTPRKYTVVGRLGNTRQSGTLVKPGANIWISGKILMLEESDSEDRLIVEDCVVYPADILELGGTPPDERGRY
jgi:hypothetical protein